MNKRKTLLCCISAAMTIAGLNCSEHSVPVSSHNNGNEFSSVSGVNLVSTDWLYSNLNNDDFTIVDLRTADEYLSGHIPNSINIPFDVISAWATSDFGPGGLWVELPDHSTLSATLGSYGISCNSKIILVTGLPLANPYSLGSPGRVAMTLAYAGLKHIGTLDGAYEKWVSEGKPVSSEPPTISTAACNCTTNSTFLVDMDYVEDNLGEVILVDARDADVYSGATLEPWSNGKPGHIPTAVSLPAASLWNTIDGTYKSVATISALANAALGSDAKQKSIVVYCGVGGYAGTVWFALTKILGYKNVKVFDGSAQQWVMTHDMVM